MKALGLWVQHLLAQIFVPSTFGLAVFLMKFTLGYKWEDLKASRREIRKILGEAKGPVILCPNHLTMIDSLLIIWAMSPAWRAWLNPRNFPWNTPEKTNYAHVPGLSLLTYLGKCLPVVRGGSPQQTQKLMDDIHRLMASSQSLMMFPEGARSLDGRIDRENYAYGVGKIIDEVRESGKDPLVILVYLRGRAQTGKTSIPHRNDTFYMKSRRLDPQTVHKGLRASRDISTQIIQGLVQMEEEYLEHRKFLGLA